MTDDRILDVIAEAVPYPAYADPARILAALRDAIAENPELIHLLIPDRFEVIANTDDWEIVPTDTAKLGRWMVERGSEFTDVAHRNLIWIAYAEAGVERP